MPPTPSPTPPPPTPPPPTPPPTPPPPTPTPTYYPHTGTDCSGTNVTIYTTNFTFNVSDPAYSNSAGNTFYSGAFVYNTAYYSYISGLASLVASHIYSYSGTDCSNASVTIYTTQSSFAHTDTAYADPCLTTTYTGSFIFNENVYSYSSGTATQYYAHVGTNCTGGSVTIYTNNSSFYVFQTAYASSCISALYNGFFIFGGSIYSYTDGAGVGSYCGSPPPTPPPSPPAYTNPNILRADIHSSYETGSGTWQTYRANVTGLFVANSGTNRSDYRDHVIREFNRKISVLNQPTGLFISPFDDGFRFTGVSI